MLLAREAPDLAVADRRLVRAVEAEHAQEAREAAEVGVGDEERGARVRARRCQDLHHVALAHRPLERRRLAVDEHRPHFRVRHAERFDRVLQACGARAGVGERPTAMRRV